VIADRGRNISRARSKMKFIAASRILENIPNINRNLIPYIMLNIHFTLCLSLVDRSLAKLAQLSEPLTFNSQLFLNNSCHIALQFNFFLTSLSLERGRLLAQSLRACNR
jgi:hypothetical protein